MYCNCDHLSPADIFPEYQKLVKFRVIKARHFSFDCRLVSTTDNLVPSGERPHSSSQEFFVFKQPIKITKLIRKSYVSRQSPSILVPRLHRLSDGDEYGFAPIKKQGEEVATLSLDPPKQSDFFSNPASTRLDN